MQRDEKKRRKKRKKSFLPKIILAAFVVYASWTLISNQVRIRSIEADTAKLDESISNEKIRKMQLEATLSEPVDDEYMREMAEEQGYVTPGTIIYEDVSDN